MEARSSRLLVFLSASSAYQSSSCMWALSNGSGNGFGAQVKKRVTLSDVNSGVVRETKGFSVRSQYHLPVKAVSVKRRTCASSGSHCLAAAE